MIAFSQEPELPSIYDRPASREVARLRDATTDTLESLDQPADFLAEALDQQLKAYEGPMPKSATELRMFVLSQFRQSASVSAVSSMLEAFIERDEQSHMAVVVRRMLVVIQCQSRPELACDALAFALGIHIGEGRTCQEIAARHGVTKQAFSKRAIRIARELGLDPSILMRSEDSRRSYQLKQLQRHEAVRCAVMGKGTLKAIRERLIEARRHVSGQQLRTAVD